MRAACGKDIKLVIVGEHGWNTQRVLTAMRPHILAADLIHVHKVPFSELQTLYESAEFCAFMPFAEGFGYCPLEAMQRGTPVVASNIPVLRWTLGDAALFVDPYSPSETADAMLRLLDEPENQEMRSQLKQKALAPQRRFALDAISEQWNGFLVEQLPSLSEKFQKARRRSLPKVRLARGTSIMMINALSRAITTIQRDPRKIAKAFTIEGQRAFWRSARSLSPHALAEKVRQYAWFHSIDVGQGVITPGGKTPDVHAIEAAAFFDPIDMTGTTVIDIGAWNGFYSFEAKRRGAKRVLATDHFCWQDNYFRGRETFDLARNALGLKIEALDIDVPELSVERVGTFDVVIFLGVFYHLLDPIDGLRRAAALAREVLVVETHIDGGINQYDRPAMVMYPGKELSDDPTNWWGPNDACMRALLGTMGFARIDGPLITTSRDTRAIYHAWRSSRLMTRPPQNEQLGCPSFTAPVSQACTQSQFEEPSYAIWCERIKEQPRHHRKQWEFCFILQGLAVNNMLGAGRRGLGYGVGTEPLTALFASHGCEIVATDMDAKDAFAAGWTTTQQHAVGLDHLNRRGICDADLFRRNVCFRVVDMNNIPADLEGCDFTWSACCLEHLGSIQHGLDFIENSLRALKPGGIAIHTTELNCSSNEHTIERGSTVLYRQRDIEGFANRVVQNGHEISLNFNLGDQPLDKYVDAPPYTSDRHLKLRIGQYTSTSFGLIIRKGAPN
jgi:SAM-dependent methyltransferase